ncbi:MAG TPA: hypothetical protein VFR86_17880 [Burkholderiaceae bacterium]|nr:hypothetical protein [Burkholderiaceae bacterium]
MMTAALARGRPIALHRNVLAVAGAAIPGIFLSQLVYWTRHGTDVVARQGWIYKTGAQWQHETAMTPKVQRRARRALLEQGLIEERRVGCPAHMEFRLNLDAFAKRVTERVRIRLEQQVDLELFRSRSEVVRELLGAVVVYHRQIAEATASVEDALFLSLLVRMQVQRDPRRPAWMALSREQLAGETGLSRGEQETARRHLRQLGAIIERHGNFPRSVAFMLDGSRIAQLVSGDTAARQAVVQRNLARLGRTPPAALAPAPTAARDQPQVGEPESRSPLAGLGTTDERESRRPVAPNPADLLRQIQPTSCAKAGQQVAPDPAFKGNEGLQESTTDHPHYSARAQSTTANGPFPVVVGDDLGPRNVGGLPQLHWPTWMPFADRGALTRWLGRVPERAQEILDEAHWCHRQRAVERPVGLVRRLVGLALAGDFVPEGAHRVAAEREPAKAQELVREEAQRRAETRLTPEQEAERTKVREQALEQIRTMLGRGAKPVLPPDQPQGAKEATPGAPRNERPRQADSGLRHISQPMDGVRLGFVPAHIARALEAARAAAHQGTLKRLRPAWRRSHA